MILIYESAHLKVAQNIPEPPKIIIFLSKLLSKNERKESLRGEKMEQDVYEGPPDETQGCAVQTNIQRGPC